MQRVAGLVVTVIVGVSHPAAAQGAAGGTSTQPALVQTLSTAPKPGESGVSATVGMQIQNGRTSTSGWSISGIAAHTTRNRHLLRLDAEMDKAKYSPAPNDPLVVVEDNQQASFTYLHLFKKRWAAMSTTAWRRDRLIQLNHRFFVDAGVGRQLIETRTVHAFLGVSYALGSESRAYSTRADGVRDIGVLQTFSYRVTPVLNFDQFLRTHVDTTDTGDRIVQFNATLTSRVSRHAGFRIYYKYQSDALHPLTQDPVQREFGAGFMVNFSPSPRAGAKP